MIGTLKAYAWQALALVLGVLLLWQSQASRSYERAALKAQSTLDSERAEAQRQARLQSEQFRDKERKLRNDHDQIERETQAALAAASAGAGRANAAGQRLRTELADYLTTHREAALARAAAGQCAPDTTALDLLADMYRRTDERAGQLALIADTARTRGLACERTHDGDRATLNTDAQAQ